MVEAQTKAIHQAEEQEAIDFQAITEAIRKRRIIHTSTATYNCPKCKDKGGFVVKEEKDGMEYEYWQDCTCVIERRIDEIINRSNLSEYQLNKTFDTYAAISPGQKKVKEICMNFSKQNSGNLILCGQIGSGKTHLAIATLLEFAKRRKAIKIFNYKDMVKKIGLAARDDLSYYQELDKYRYPTVVLIDDFFKGNDHKETHLSYTYEVINYRYEKNKTTIITTEKRVKDMIEIEEAVASRLLEHAKGFVVSMDGIKNYRIK